MSWTTDEDHSRARRIPPSRIARCIVMIGMIATIGLSACTGQARSDSASSESRAKGYFNQYASSVPQISGVSSVKASYVSKTFEHGQAATLEARSDALSDQECRTVYTSILKRSIDYHVESWGNVKIHLYCTQLGRWYEYPALGLGTHAVLGGSELRAAIQAKIVASATTTPTTAG